MGPTGGESFPTPFRTVLPQREQDDTVGDKQHREDEEAERTTVGKHPKMQDVSVSAGELQEWVQVTHDVIYDIGATEWQVESKGNLNHGVQEPPHQGYPHQNAAEPPVHDGSIV